MCTTLFYESLGQSDGFHHTCYTEGRGLNIAFESLNKRVLQKLGARLELLTVLLVELSISTTAFMAQMRHNKSGPNRAFYKHIRTSPPPFCARPG